jgi:hypothetical protein
MCGDSLQEDDDMKKLIEPTIGRKLYYWPAPSEPVEVYDVLQPCDATIVFVHNDHTVNLSVMDHDGDGFNCQKVTLRQPGEPEPERPYCSWMPYQIAQAQAQPFPTN